MLLALASARCVGKASASAGLLRTLLAMSSCRLEQGASNGPGYWKPLPSPVVKDEPGGHTLGLAYFPQRTVSAGVTGKSSLHTAWIMGERTIPIG